MYLTIKDVIEFLPKIKGVTYKQFELSDAFNITNGAFEGYSAQRLIGVKELLESQSKYGFAITCFLYGEPVACFGCAPLWKGVAEMWSVIGNNARTHPIAMTKTGISFADICEIYFHLHRLQITVKTSDKRANSWARAIGFTFESTMKQYSSDSEDYNLMVRIKNG